MFVRRVGLLNLVVGFATLMNQLGGVAKRISSTERNIEVSMRRVGFFSTLLRMHRECVSTCCAVVVRVRVEALGFFLSTFGETHNHLKSPADFL